MDELWSRGVYFVRTTSGKFCTWSRERISEGEYAVRVPTEGLVDVWIALGVVDEAVNVLRAVADGRAGDVDVPDRHRVRLVTDVVLKDTFSCQFCGHLSECSDASWITLPGRDARPALEVCSDCLPKFADALEGVWDRGHLLTADEL